MKKTRTLILIANGSRAKFLSHSGPGKGLSTLRDLSLERDVLHTRDIQADKPGRTHDRSGRHRHAMEYSSDPQETELSHFADQCAQRAETTLSDSSFDRIIVVSSPDMLSYLRRSLAPAVQKKVYAEIDKDLTQIPDTDLPSHFRKVLAV